MIDRTINLITLLAIAFAVLLFAVSIHSAWNDTPAWQQGWVAKHGVASKYSASRITHAMQKASEAGDQAAVATLQQVLDAAYEPSGQIFVRLALSEIMRSLGNAGLALLLLLLPLSLNYVRHNKVRLWNRST
ncbi:MAG: hypothetical protein WB783_15705 [Arenicellales bacterium]